MTSLSLWELAGLDFTPTWHTLLPIATWSPAGLLHLTTLHPSSSLTTKSTLRSSPSAASLPYLDVSTGPSVSSNDETSMILASKKIVSLLSMQKSADTGRAANPLQGYTQAVDWVASSSDALNPDPHYFLPAMPYSLLAGYAIQPRLSKNRTCDTCTHMHARTHACTHTHKPLPVVDYLNAVWAVSVVHLHDCTCVYMHVHVHVM